MSERAYFAKSTPLAIARAIEHVRKRVPVPMQLPLRSDECSLKIEALHDP